MATLNLGRVGFVNKGTYSDTTPYKVNDVVIYNRGTYACIQANTGNLPTDIAYWQVWVENTAPSNTGEGATGTWDINITGSASKLNNKVESIPIIANTLVERDNNGNINTNTVNISETATVDVSTNYYVETNNDGYLRPKSLADVKTEIAGDKVSLSNNETIGGIKTFTDGIVLQNSNVSPFSGFKNYIINGNFNIWQRGTSFTGLTNGTYSADRWVVYDSVGNINYNVVRNADVFNAGYGATYSFNSSTGIRSIIQFIENVTRFKVGSNVTISFEAYTNSTPYTIAVAIQGVKGVWASATGEVASNIALTNTKTKYSVTLPIPDWTSLGIDWAHLEDTKLALKFNLEANTNGRDFILGSVQLEEGSVATPFENRPYGLELSLCQRYYEVGYVDEFYNYNDAIKLIGTGTKYKNTKRVVPTITLSYGVLEQSRIDGFAMYGTIDIRQWLSNVVFTASAEL